MPYYYGIYVLDFLEETLEIPEDLKVAAELEWMPYRLIGTDFIMIRYGADPKNPKKIEWFHHSLDVNIHTMMWCRDRVDFAEVFDSISEELKLKMIPHLELLSHVGSPEKPL